MKLKTAFPLEHHNSADCRRRAITTLLYSARDERRNQAVVLQAVLRKQLVEIDGD
jgi:uncharacterized protein YeaO (DUF488 family)